MTVINYHVYNEVCSNDTMTCNDTGDQLRDFFETLFMRKLQRPGLVPEDGLHGVLSH